MTTSPQIFIGGWTRFREECGVTKKEPVEDFAWMGSQASEFLPNLRWIINGARDYEECREALSKVEGAREYLKTYVAKEEGEGFNFIDPIGEQIVLGNQHSGASYSALLWDYHHLLNDWDGWVLMRKEYAAFREYKKIQADPAVICGLYHNCRDLLDGNKGRFPVVESDILAQARTYGLHGGVEEIYPIVSHLFTEHMARLALEAAQQKKKEHTDLIDGLTWKYKHPSRWFDTPWGSSILPSTPRSITPEAYAEMEAKYPGYTQHIQQVKTALFNYRLPDGVTRYSQAGEAYTKELLSRYAITA